MSEILGKLLFWCGEDKIIYGSEVLPHLAWYILTRPDKFHNIVSVQQAAL
jgi:hypothetical protein